MRIISPNKNGICLFTKILLLSLFTFPSAESFAQKICEEVSLAVDVLPGNNDGNPRNLIVFQGKIFFRADDAAGDNELWVSDGTPGGTTLFKNINPTGDSFAGQGQGQNTGHIIFQNKLYFRATDGINDDELWVSDGTTTGTVLLKDINPTSSSIPDFFVELNGKIYFKANDGTNGAELWVSDGTNAGTLMLKDINPTGNSNPQNLTVINGKIYFKADDGINDDELWVSDGTNAGTVMLKNIHPTGGSFPQYFAELNGKAYFRATDDTNGSELWQSDGTTAGTVLFKNINPTGSSFLDELTKFNGKLYFQANSGDGDHLWATDGTSAGTIKIFATQNPQRFHVFNNMLYFQAMGELWISDGTSTGTRLLKDINPTGDSRPEHFVTFKDKLFFSADDGVNGKELWSISCTILTPPIPTLSQWGLLILGLLILNIALVTIYRYQEIK